LLFSNSGHVFDGGVTRVFSKAQGDFLKSIGKRANRVLLDTLNFVSSLGNSDGAGQLGSTATSNNVVVFDHVPHDTDGVMKAAAGLVADNSGSTSDNYGDGLGLGALLNKDKAVIGGTEADFLDHAGLTKLLGGDLLESGHDTRATGNSEELNFDTTNPSNGWHISLHQ